MGAETVISVLHSSDDEEVVSSVSGVVSGRAATSLSGDNERPLQVQHCHSRARW